MGNKSIRNEKFVNTQYRVKTSPHINRRVAHRKNRCLGFALFPSRFNEEK